MAVSPVTFKRGSTFSFSLKLPDTIADGTFKEYTLKAQLRREKHDGPSGLIAELGVFWMDPATNRYVGLYDPLTDKWPLGNAEMDVVFISPGGQRVRSNTVPVIIQRGITR